MGLPAGGSFAKLHEHPSQAPNKVDESVVVVLTNIWAGGRSVRLRPRAGCHGYATGLVRGRARQILLASVIAKVAAVCGSYLADNNQSRSLSTHAQRIDGAARCSPHLWASRAVFCSLPLRMLACVGPVLYRQHISVIFDGTFQPSSMAPSCKTGLCSCLQSRCRSRVTAATPTSVRRNPAARSSGSSLRACEKRPSTKKARSDA
jgi:hypothetical protein